MTRLIFQPGRGLANTTALVAGSGGNSPDTLGTSWANLYAGSGTETASSDHPRVGQNNAKFLGASGQNAVARYPFAAGSAVTSVSAAFYYSGTPPVIAESIAGGFTGVAFTWNLSINSTGHLVLVDAAGGNPFTSTAALTVGWWRFSLFCTSATATTGSMQFAYYADQTNTATQTMTAATNWNLGLAAATTTLLEVGRRQTTAQIGTFYFTDIQVDNVGGSFIPFYAQPATTVAVRGVSTSTAGTPVITTPGAPITIAVRGVSTSTARAPVVTVPSVTVTAVKATTTSTTGTPNAAIRIAGSVTQNAYVVV